MCVSDRAPRVGHLQRRSFIKALAIGIGLPMVIPLLAQLLPASMRRRLLRPPGALRGEAFLDSCTGCAQCATVCPNKCITMSGLETGLEGSALR